MASRSGGNVVWTVVLIVLAVIVGLAAVFGPRLYREGRAFVGPIMELSRAESAVSALNEELAFEPPTSKLVPEDRLTVFLEVREEIKPLYERWSQIEAQIEESGDPDSLDNAKEVLGVLGDGFTSQLEVLRRHRMSPAEYTWLDKLIYGKWLAGGNGEESADRRLVHSTQEDLEFMEQIRRRHGDSSGLRAIEERLRGRLESLEEPHKPEMQDLPEETGELLWRNHDRITALVLDRSSPYLDLLEGGSGDIRVNLSDDGTTVDVSERPEG